MKQQRFAIGEEVIIQSKYENPNNGHAAFVLGAIWARAYDAIKKQSMGYIWAYELDIKASSSSGMWAETALKKKPKGSDLTFPELLANLNQPIKSMSKT